MKVAVVYGGMSAERAVSLVSGAQVINGLRAAGFDVVPVLAGDDLGAILTALTPAPDVVFNALHGRFGEDGCIQGVLDWLGLRYTHSGVRASALAMDKWRTKLIWQAAGIPTPQYRMLTQTSDWLKVVDELKLPLIVKPAREGSSIGVTKVKSASELPAAFALAFKLDPLVIAEQFIAGQELTASVVGAEALPLIRIDAPEGAYDYQNKYFTDFVKYRCPAGIRAEVEDEIRAMTMKAFRVLGCDGWGRADMMLAPDGRFSFLEMNTSPGMTSHSLVPMAARAVGMSYADLCLHILQSASLKS